MKTEPATTRELERLIEECIQESNKSVAYTSNYKKSTEQYLRRFLEWTKGNHVMKGVAPKKFQRSQSPAS